MCVDDVRGLGASRSRDVEAERGDADRDGQSWLQRHGSGFVTGITRDYWRWHADGKRRGK